MQTRQNHFRHIREYASEIDSLIQKMGSCKSQTKKESDALREEAFLNGLGERSQTRMIELEKTSSNKIIKLIEQVEVRIEGRARKWPIRKLTSLFAQKRA